MLIAANLVKTSSGDMVLVIRGCSARTDADLLARAKELAAELCVAKRLADTDFSRLVPAFTASNEDETEKERRLREHAEECRQAFAIKPKKLGVTRRRGERFGKRGWRW